MCFPFAQRAGFVHVSSGKEASPDSSRLTKTRKWAQNGAALVMKIGSCLLVDNKGRVVVASAMLARGPFLNRSVLIQHG
jgi:hypothetical protein